MKTTPNEVGLIELGTEKLVGRYFTYEFTAEVIKDIRKALQNKQIITLYGRNNIISFKLVSGQRFDGPSCRKIHEIAIDLKLLKPDYIAFSAEVSPKRIYPTL